MCNLIEHMLINYCNSQVRMDVLTSPVISVSQQQWTLILLQSQHAYPILNDTAKTLCVV